MEWVRPEILWGLAALIIPVLIHLLHLRKFRKVSFSNVSFLANIKKESRSKHRLRNLLILALRLTAIGAIVCAFADPYIPYSETSQDSSRVGNAVSIYIDTSPSIDAIGEEGPLLQVCKTRASEIVERYAETDKFNILTNSFAGSYAHFYSKDETLERIAGIRTEPFVRNVEAVISRSTDLLQKENDRVKSIYYLSDLQKSSHVLSDPFLPDSNISIYFLPSLANERPNVWIDSAWFNAPIATAGKPAELHVRIKHNALQSVDGLGVQLHIDGERKAIANFNLIPGLETDTVLRFSHGQPGLNHAVLSIDDSPIQFDDTYFLGYEVVDQINILHLTQDAFSKETKSLNRVYESSSASVNIETSESIPDPQTLSSFDLIITNGLENPTNGLTKTLVEFASLGGTVVVIPDSSNSAVRANYLRTQLGFGSGSQWNLSESPVSIGNLNVDHPLFDGVFSSTPKRMDLPSTDRCISRNISPDEEILGTMSSGLVFLSRTPVNNGAAFLFGSPLEKETGNMVNHALFVPILLRISEVSRSARVNAFTLGLDDALTLNIESNEEDEIRISSLDSASVTLPETRSAYGSTNLRLGPELDTPGNYFVEIDQVQVLAFGLNADRTESNPSAWDIPTFRQQLSSFGWGNASVLNVTNETISSVVGNLDTGNHFWWYLILVVIIALAGETILQKRWKRTYS